MNLKNWKAAFIGVTALSFAACSQTPSIVEPALGVQSITVGKQVIRYKIENGLAIYQGDIVLGTTTQLENLKRNPRSLFHDQDCNFLFCSDHDYRWKNGEIPYLIDSSVTTAGNTHVQEAITEWRTKTRIKLVPRTTQSDYVVFKKGDEAGVCRSNVGRQGGAQNISLLSSGDCDRGSLIHEIGHAVGLYHEQGRSDRDKYIKVLFENMESNGVPEYDRQIDDALDIGAYDYASIMHYGAKYFSKNGKPTIETIPPGIAIGQRNGLSAGDLAAVSWLYLKDWVLSADGKQGWYPINISNIKASDMGFGDFDGDKITDTFYGDGTTWFVSYKGRSAWTPINTSSFTVSDLRFYDFDGDKKTDVFRRAPNSEWQVSYGGTGAWTTINSSGFALSSYGFGDFDGNGKTDVFRPDGSKWFVSYDGTGFWQELNTSSFGLSDLRFGDFDGNHKTDVFRRAPNSEWQVSYSGVSPWTTINSSVYPLSDYLFGDFNNDGKTDVFRNTDDQWFVSYGGTGFWTSINANMKLAPYTTLSGIRLGDFNGDGRSDVFGTLTWKDSY